jgi:RecA-family ATPase
VNGSPEEILAALGVKEAPVVLMNEAWAQPSGTSPRAIQLPTFSASSLASSPAPRREFHVDELVPARAVTLLGGDGGTGKSLLALQLAVSTALGLPWLGFRVVQGPSLFLTAEDETDEVHRRLEDIVRDLNKPLRELRDLHIISLAGEDALLGVWDKKESRIVATSLFAQLEASVRNLKPVVVNLDTLADVFGGEEIMRAQARQFVSLLRGLALRNNTTILLVAHPSIEGMKTGTGTSGSTAWSNCVRSRLYLERVKDEHDTDTRVLKIMKANYSSVGTEIRMRWQRGVFVPTQTTPAPSGLTLLAAQEHADQVFLELLTAYQVEKREVSPKPSSAYAPTVFAKDARSQGIGARGLEQAMNRLFTAKRIRVIETGPPSRRRQRIALADCVEDGR